MPSRTGPLALGAALNALDHNSYYHALSAPTIYYLGVYQTLTEIQDTYGLETAAPAGKIEDPLFVDPAGADGVYGTPDDDYRLRALSPVIDNAATLSGSFSVNLSGGDQWFEERTGYGLLTFGLDDALCPMGTDWTTNPPTVVTVKQGANGAGWERGAYVYR